MSTGQAAPAQPVSRLEILAFVGALAAGIALLPFVGGAFLWTRPFWMDELCCTVFPVNDSASPFDLIRNVTRDDVAPPLLHVIVWTVTGVAGSTSPLVVRNVALVCVCLALLVLYATMRRRFGRAASAAAVLAVASHTLVLHHAFDARFYGPWLLFGVAYAWSLGLDPDRARSRRRDVAQAVFAVCICSIHWFGVTSLFLMALAAAATHGRRWRDGVRFVAPSAAGVVALVAFSPMMFAQLRQGGEDLLWVTPLSTSQVLQMVQLFLLRVPLVLAILLLVGDRFRRGGARASVTSIFFDPSHAALMSLVLMPVVLIVITVVLEPVMVMRYAILATVAGAPVIALAVESIGAVGRGLVLTLFALLLVGFADKEIRFSKNFDDVMGAYAADFQQTKSANIPIVFQSYFIMYPVDGPSRRRSVARFLELPDSSIAALYPAASQEPARAKLRLDRNQVRLHHTVLGFPIPVTQAQLDSAPRFFLMATDDGLPAGHENAVAFGQQLFPRHKGKRLSSIVTLFERVPAP